LSSTLLLPGEPEPLTQGWDIKERLDHVVDGVIDSGECGTEPTTVVDLSGDEPEIVRVGAGDPAGARCAPRGWARNLQLRQSGPERWCDGRG